MHCTVPCAAVTPETVSLETIDGVRLEADIVWAAAPQPLAFVVIGHPHPQYGGDRHNHVVRALQTAAFAAGCHSIAPDFRGAGGSFGDHDNGDSERLDLAAACQMIDLVEDSVPVVMAGYSFGSVVAMNVTTPDIAGWLAVAPPVPMMTDGVLAAASHRPKHILLPRHDQFSTVEAIDALTSTWANTTVTVLESVDHFIAAGAEDACTAGLSAILARIS
jgi:alpha/beta superfamily hydrolase